MAEGVAERAFRAGRAKVFFPGWRQVDVPRANGRHAVRLRYIRVGFADQIPAKPQLAVGFCNADPFLASGPLAGHIRNAYAATDIDLLDGLLMTALFAQGSAFWTVGTLNTGRPAAVPADRPHTPNDEENPMCWSGPDPARWRRLCEELSHLEQVTSRSVHRRIEKLMQHT